MYMFLLYLFYVSYIIIILFINYAHHHFKCTSFAVILVIGISHYDPYLKPLFVLFFTSMLPHLSTESLVFL